MITVSLNGIEERLPEKVIRNKGKNLVAFPDKYCVIDIETTGLSPDFDSIIEISGILFENGQEFSRYTSLVKPDSVYDDGSYIDEFIENLTGITNEMLSSAPDTQAVLREFKDFISNNILVGHNINFDINFLYDNFQHYLSTTLSNDFIDTMRLSRILHPEESHHRLSDLADRYDIDYSNAHRSLVDCQITELCYEHLKEDILSRDGSFDSFIEQWKKHRHGLTAADIHSNSTDFDVSHPLYGKVCVFTGTLEKMPRKEAMQLVADVGGINADTVTKKTNFLILANNNYSPLVKGGKSTKQKKAEKLKLEGVDIEVIPENVFYDMFDNN